MPRSMSNSASMRLTASSAIGEIAAALFATPRVGGDVGQFEELPPRMRPTQCRRDRRLVRAPDRKARCSRYRRRPAGCRLKSLQMPLGMLLPPVARGVIERGRRRGPAKRPVVADIDPDAAGDRLALGQDRHRGVVAVQPLGRQNMRSISA